MNGFLTIANAKTQSVLLKLNQGRFALEIKIRFYSNEFFYNIINTKSSP